MKHEPDFKTLVYGQIAHLAGKPLDTVDDDTPLIGNGSTLDSMKLVELCLSLEDIANEIGFEFDWTSETAMSVSRGMFRTAGSVLAEFESQHRKKQ